MAEQILFELVSPERLLFSKNAAMVVMPGDAGVFGVLAGHAPIISSLGAGVVDIYEQNETSVTDRYFVAGGFAEVDGKSCTILAEQATPVSELDKDSIVQEIKSLNEMLAAAPEEKKAEIEAKLVIARAKLAAI
jgi:F-type H+-transporting ATPase subunit epsilon